MTSLIAKIRAAVTGAIAPNRAAISVPENADPRIVAQLRRIMVLRQSGKMTEEAFRVKRDELLEALHDVSR